MSMSLEELNTHYETLLKQSLHSKKKNIVFLLHYPTYYSHYASLPTVLAEKFHVILVGGLPQQHPFEKLGHHYLHIPYRVKDAVTNQVFYTDVNVSGIDLIITADIVGYDNGRIDREFLSKDAKRLYLPHAIFQATGKGSRGMDYIAVPSMESLKDYQQASWEQQPVFLETGYPRIDALIKAYQSAPKKERSTIVYAPTLRDASYHPCPLNIALVAGVDNLIIEYLLEATRSNICYRPHPMSFMNTFRCYEQVKQKWAKHKRVLFDESDGGNYFNAKLFITDMSTAAYSFSLATLKPSIFFLPSEQNADRLHDIVFVAQSLNELDKLLKADSLSSQMEDKIHHCREKNLFHIGKSEIKICEYIERIVHGQL